MDVVLPSKHHRGSDVAGRPSHLDFQLHLLITLPAQLRSRAPCCIRDVSLMYLCISTDSDPSDDRSLRCTRVEQCLGDGPQLTIKISHGTTWTSQTASAWRAGEEASSRERRHCPAAHCLCMQVQWFDTTSTFPGGICRLDAGPAQYDESVRLGTASVSLVLSYTSALPEIFPSCCV
jgi:hypothetical protein